MDLSLRTARPIRLTLNVLAADSLPRCHRGPGSDDGPLCPAGVRGDDLHTPGVHLLRLYGYHVPLWSVQFSSSVLHLHS